MPEIPFVVNAILSGNINDGSIDYNNVNVKFIENEINELTTKLNASPVGKSGGGKSRKTRGGKMRKTKKHRNKK